MLINTSFVRVVLSLGLILAAPVYSDVPCPPSLESELSSCGAPSWFTSAPEMTWITPVTNTHDDVLDPNSGTNGLLGAGGQKLYKDWNGAGYDYINNAFFMLANGGHNGYYGNEAYAIFLNQESPKVVRLRDSDVNNPNDDSRATPEGRPTAHHSAGNLVAGEGRWFILGQWAPSGAGTVGYPGSYWEFDWTGTKPGRIDSKPGVADYIDHGNRHPASSQIHQLALWDPVDRHLIKVMPDNSGMANTLVFQSIDDVSGTADYVRSSGIKLVDSGGYVGALDAKNRVILVRMKDGSWYWTRIGTVSEKQNARWNTITPSNDPWNGAPMDPLWGFDWWTGYNKGQGAFVTWDGSNGILVGVPTLDGQGNYTGLRWTSHKAVGGPTPHVSHLRMYNKIRVAKDMGNGQSAVVIWNDWSDPPVHVLKLPPDGVL